MIAESSVVELLIDLLSMALVGAIDVWVGIVGGLALGLPPVLSGAASIAGVLVGAVITVVAGQRVQRWIYARPWLSKRRKRVERLWNRYGVAGVALGLGVPRKGMLLWMVMSVVLWAVVITGVAVLAFSLFDG